ncbi:MAG: efflux RND transporter permease subunit, partial [Candidatus Glassbacteria bacterium]|nr:efflux RND transporter permease subunit [Candidatus Glassbacteria bacterium]
YVDVNAPTGTNLQTSDRLVRQVEEAVAALPDIENCVANVGHQGNDFFAFGGGSTHQSRIMVDMLDREDRSQSSWLTLDRLREKMSHLTGAEIKVEIEENGPPTGPPINIEISGDDFTVLGRLAGEVRRMIAKVDGVVDIDDDYDAGRPELRVAVDREKAALVGLNTRDVAFTIRTAINGTEAAKYRVGEDEYDITVRFAEDKRSSIEDLRNISVFHEGQQIPLASLARVEVAGGAGTVLHKDLKRVVTVSAEVEGRNANAALQECKQLMQEFELPSSYLYEFTGQDEEQEESAAFLTRAFILALFLIGMVLISQFNSLVLPFVIMFSVILSMIGVMIGLIATSTPFGIIMTGMGVISLAGVVVNNAIVLIDYIQKLRVRGFAKDQAVIQAGLVRFRPVMLTAITTILGLIPLTTGIGFDFTSFKWQIGGESSQWWGPMGVAVIFGLAFATLLTLVVVPVMYKLLTGITDRLGIKPAYLRKMETVEHEDKAGTGVVR